MIPVIKTYSLIRISGKKKKRGTDNVLYTDVFADSHLSVKEYVNIYHSSVIAGSNLGLKDVIMYVIRACPLIRSRCKWGPQGACVRPDSLIRSCDYRMFETWKDGRGVCVCVRFFYSVLQLFISCYVFWHRVTYSDIALYLLVSCYIFWYRVTSFDVRFFIACYIFSCRVNVFDIVLFILISCYIFWYCSTSDIVLRLLISSSIFWYCLIFWYRVPSFDIMLHLSVLFILISCYIFWYRLTSFASVKGFLTSAVRVPMKLFCLVLHTP